LPTPRPANLIDRFSAVRSATSLDASWHVASTLPDDRALLIAQPSFVLSGNIFGV
jgi:hypothetical protein